jgi:dethiobiotin synthetase
VTRFVVTGTDTGIGKTVLAAALTSALQARYWKPVQAGLEGETDSVVVARLSGLGAEAIIPEAYRLTTPCSPHQAAALDGVMIDPTRLALPDHAGPLVIEGAGGVLVPLAEGFLSADLFARWGLPVVLAARTTLGTINHTLLSVEALRARQVPIAGVAFIGDANAESERVICAEGHVRRLGRLPLLDPLTADDLAAAFAAGFDLGGLL